MLWRNPPWVQFRLCSRRSLVLVRGFRERRPGGAAFAAVLVAQEGLEVRGAGSLLLSPTEALDHLANS